MSTLAGFRLLNRSSAVGIGSKDFKTGKTNFVNLENKRVQRDLARHGTLGQYIQSNPPRFQLDTGTVDLGGTVTPRTGSLVLDVTAAQLTSLDGVTKGASAAGTATVAPNATLPQLSAIGLDTTTFATPTIAAVILNTPAATVTESRSLTFPASLPTFPAVDTTANRTWLALVWVPPSLTGITSVAGTGVITTGSAHGYVVGDQVWFSALTGGAGIVVNTLYTVTSVPSTTTFVTNATHSTNLTAGTVQRQILAVDVLDIRP
jgi:hypothetical protein